MALAVTDHHLLRVAAGQRRAQPGLRQLPEQGAFAAVFTSHFGADQQTAEQRFSGWLIELPEQLLTVRIACEQPVTGRPQRLPHGQCVTLVELDRAFAQAIEAQANQRLPVQAQAQTAFSGIGYQLAARRQGQGSQVIQIGHGSGSR